MSSAPEGEGVERPAKRLCVAQDAFENYDVFVSHRGPDTKSGFVGFLYEALKRVGLHPFLDCKSIVEGQDCWKCIERAIQTTPLALVIFSEGFTQSEWCLRELHTMLACPSVKVLSIFYNVEPWEVRFVEKGQLALGFQKLIERHDKTSIEEWMVDLIQASKIKGWEHRVGDKRKSTLARELYNQLGRRYEASCYVEDIAEKVKKCDVMAIQNQILKGLCENEWRENIVDKSRGKVILQERLSKKRILMVLDDVRDGDQMKYLMSRSMLVEEGSMCVVTSRDCRVFEKLTSFVNHEVHTHDVQLLSQEDSQTVFASHAFGGDGEVPQEFRVLVGDVSMACGGVPLVLEVCGRLLMDEKDVRVWNEVLDKLRGCTILIDTKIFECLSISYDALSKEHQEIFMDIACALLGESVEKAKLIWRHGVLGVRSLVEKALIRVDEFGILCMHDQLRDMGREIARDENLRICKRIWDFDSLVLLNENEPLPNSMESLVLQRGHRIGGDLSLMRRLRIFKCGFGKLLMSSFPESLRWFEIMGGIFGTLRDIPESPKNNELEILIWKDSLFKKLPESFGNLRKLEVLNLRGCCGLMKLPHSFGDLQKLNHLYLERSRIQSLPQSFGNLSNLELLNLEGCDQLVELPNSFGGLQNLIDLNLEGSGIQSLPQSFGNLSNLKMLDLMACHQLVELPNSFGGLQNLIDLNLRQSGIQSLPQSFGNFSNLEVLNLGSCCKLLDVPNSFGGLQNLIDLNLEGSGIQSLPQSFGNLSNLKMLDLMACHQLVELPNSFGGLQNLIDLNLRQSGIQSLPQSFGNFSNLEVLNLGSCCKLLDVPNSFGGLQSLIDLNLEGSGIQSLPQSFGNLSNLKVLNLRSCYKLLELPNSFGSLHNLIDLNLEGSGIQSLPQSFGNLSNLKVFNLGSCCKLLEVPNSFGSLHNLIDLNLEGSGIQSLRQSF